MAIFVSFVRDVTRAKLRAILASSPPREDCAVVCVASMYLEIPWECDLRAATCASCAAATSFNEIDTESVSSITSPMKNLQPFSS